MANSDNITDNIDNIPENILDNQTKKNGPGKGNRSPMSPERIEQLRLARMRANVLRKQLNEVKDIPVKKKSGPSKMEIEIQKYKNIKYIEEVPKNEEVHNLPPTPNITITTNASPIVAVEEPVVILNDKIQLIDTTPLIQQIGQFYYV